MKEYNIYNMQTDEYIERTARERLGMIKENEIIFKEQNTGD
jgi:cell division protein DivIC